MLRITILAIALCLFSCGREKPKETAAKNPDTGFDSYKQNFILSLWKIYPGWASGVGYHQYDSALTIPDDTQRQKELDFFSAHADSLKKFDLPQLSDGNQIDYHLIDDYLKAAAWAINDLKSHEWDPSNYNVCGSFAEMLNNNYDSLDERLRNFSIRLKQVPAYYEAAKKNIRSPTAEHTQLSILQNEGGVSLFEQDLVPFLEKSHLPAAEKTELMDRAKMAASAVKDFAAFLKKHENPAPRSFRLGKEQYVKKFDHDLQSGFSADEIFQKALARKKFLHEKMYALANQLWPKYLKNKKMPADTLIAIREMIDVLSARHVKPDSFQSAIEQQIPALVAFIKKKNLIHLDPTKPLVVRKEPAYMAGMAGASISSPGPYDVNGNTYYNVGSMAGWSKEKAESYLREYNHYILQILNIHEAIPGHYTQLIYSNQSAIGDGKSTFRYPGIVKAIFGNGAMIEGWAVYTELMMLENGYGAPAGSTETEPEMWLMYYKWNLRSTCNTILDHNVHVNELSREDAIRFLTNEAFQQQAEAEGKWRRATLSQVQLCSYFTGFSEIVALREELKQKMGDRFDLKKFHEQFLSYGSAPVKYIRELMLKEI